MANLSGVNIQKGKPGANVRNADDSISGIVIAAPEPAGLTHDVPVTVFNINDVEDLGITAEYDEQENVNAYRHLKEFYRLAGAGTELHLMVVAETTTMTEILEEGAQAEVLLVTAQGKIRQLAVGVNPEGEIVTVDGLPQDVSDAIAEAQRLAEWAYQNHMPTQVFLEGFHFNGPAASAADLRDIENLEATKVTLVIGQDYQYAETKTGNAQKFADVGTVLGVCSRATVNQNIGENESFNITDATRNAWMVPGLSSHQKNSEVYSQLQTLEDKGYVFGVTYTGLAGVRINNDHVCAPIIVDEDNVMNEHTVAYGRVMDKAARSLRTVYLPKVKTDWPVDEATGKLSPGTIVALEDIGDNVFENMQRRGEITSGSTTVDPESDLLVEKVLKLSYSLVPRGSINEINGVINLKTQL